MGLIEFKDDIKTLFLILNSICGIIGLYEISNGVSMAILFGVLHATGVVIVVIVAGSLAVILAMLGCLAAMLEKRIMLIIYSAAMMVLKAVMVVMATINYASNLQRNDSFSFRSAIVQSISFLLCNVFITLSTVALAVTLAVLAGRQARHGTRDTELNSMQRDGGK